MKSIEFKIIISIILFTIFIVGLERYQISKSVTAQFIKSKKSKNALLINTIMPIISLNFSLGLNSSNRAYLQEIKNQNSDLDFVRLVDAQDNIIYEYIRENAQITQNVEDYNYCTRAIVDDFTQEKLATLELKFSNIEYENMRKANQKILINTTLITLVLLLIFVYFLKHMFKNLKELRDSVLLYDPKLNNFALKASDKEDEVSLIRNAIVSMVEKIRLYTEMLDSTNALLEEKVKQRTRELEISNNELKLQASIDPLTSLYNRRYFTNSSKQILEIAKRDKTKLSIMMFDIDKFKHVNDTYGHQSGDEVLKTLASLIVEMTRKSDITCRFGGEEFIVLFPQTKLESAYEIAEKVREKVQITEIKTLNSIKIFVSISIGVAQYNDELDETIEEFINRADSAMYEAKKKGRNNTCISK